LRGISHAKLLASGTSEAKLLSPDPTRHLIQFINPAKIVKNFTNFSCRRFARRLNIRCVVWILILRVVWPGSGRVQESKRAGAGTARPRIRTDCLTKRGEPSPPHS
jgi:hypothetical protein